MAVHRGLGKGLSALLGEDELEQKKVDEINVYDISPNPNQPRRAFNEEAMEELCQNIRENGIITPITLRKLDEGYEIIAGERRFRAARQVGLDKIPAIILDIDEKKAFQLSIVENLQREDLTPIEEAKGFKRLMEEYSMTQDEVSKAVSKSRPAIANSIRLLDLPEIVISKVEQGSISAGHGRTLLQIKELDKMEDCVNQIIELGLSVRATEDLVKDILSEVEQLKQDEPVMKNPERIYIEQVERKVTSLIGRNVSITKGKRKGKLYIEFYGNEDLDSLVEELSKLKV